MSWLGNHTFVLQAEDGNDDSDDAEGGDADEEPEASESDAHVRAHWIPLLWICFIYSHLHSSHCFFDYSGWTVGCYSVVISRLTMWPQDE